MPDDRSDPLNEIAALRRPRLLVRAARFGLADYDRRRALKRLLPGMTAPGPRAALAALMEREAAIEANRVSGAASYLASRHVEVLIALMAEARLASGPIPVPQAFMRREDGGASGGSPDNSPDDTPEGTA